MIDINERPRPTIEQIERAAIRAGFTPERMKDLGNRSWLYVPVGPASDVDGAVCFFPDATIIDAKHHTAYGPELELLLVRAANVVQAAKNIMALAEVES
jgi:hypothetical protein